MSRTETIGDCTLYLGDCLEILPTLGKVDAVVTDPPYGIGEAGGKAKTRTSGLTSTIRNAQVYRRDYGNDGWDDKPVAPELMALVRSAGRQNIIFGGNYYDLPPTSCWLIWDKLNGATDFADCEMAWTNLPKAVRRIQYLWNGCMRQERSTPRKHPTQKPVGVMTWALGHLIDAHSVIDPFMGAGTTGVACVALGLKFTGIEREPKYFDIACRRIEEAYPAAQAICRASAKDEAGRAAVKEKGPPPQTAPAEIRSAAQALRLVYKREHPTQRLQCQKRGTR